MVTTRAASRNVIPRAPLPPHYAALVVGFFATFITMLPSRESFDEIATVETFTKRVFPQIVGEPTLAWVRIAFATIIWATMFQTAFLSPGWIQVTSYLQGSKLKMAPNHMVGWKTFCPFTSVSWNILGLYFSLSGYIAMAATKGQTVSATVLRAAYICWALAAPFALLVASTIRFAIWETVLKNGLDTTNLKSLRNKLMHNANVIFVLSELALLGGVPVRIMDLALPPLVGTIYVVFTILMQNSWNLPEHGPQFIYFFFDTTLTGYRPAVMLMGLLFALTLFYILFCSAELILSYIGRSLATHLAFVIILSSSVMRFRD